MWVYHYRIWDHFPQQVISLAVLADDQKEWHPDAYRWGLGGCSLEFRFPVFKVMDCPDPEEEFERTGNLFALVVAAHRVALATLERAERPPPVVRLSHFPRFENSTVITAFSLS